MRLLPVLVLLSAARRVGLPAPQQQGGIRGLLLLWAALVALLGLLVVI
jgi:hypothetical protein